MWYRGCENAMARTGWEGGLSDSDGGFSCGWCVRTKVHMSIRSCGQRHHVWMTNWSTRLVWFCWPKLCSRKWTCLVGRLCIDNGLFSTIFKVCVFLCCILCEVGRRWSWDRSTWSYLYDPRSGVHLSSSGWIVLDLEMHLTPVLLDSETTVPLPSLHRHGHGICFWNLLARRAIERLTQFVGTEKDLRVMVHNSWY